MKKLFMKIVAGLMALGCLMVVVGCSSPKLNIDNAEEMLRAKDYEVEMDHNEEFEGIEGVVEKALYAERDDLWIEIYEFKNKKTAKAVYQALKSECEAEIQAMKAYIELYEHILEEYEDKLNSDEIDELEDSIKEYKDDLEELEEKLEAFGINGTCIWYANDIDVIEDAQ